MKDKTLIIKQGRQYFAKGGLDGIYKKLYAYEQIADKPEKVIAIDKVLEIIDSLVRESNITIDNYNDVAIPSKALKAAVLALKGGEHDRI